MADFDLHAVARELARHKAGKGATCKCGWAGDRTVAFDKGASVADQHNRHVAEAILALASGPAAPPARRHTHRGLPGTPEAEGRKCRELATGGWAYWALTGVGSSAWIPCSLPHPEAPHD